MRKQKLAYVLSAIRYRTHNDGRKGHYVKTEHDSVECWTEKIGVFSCVSNAEDVIGLLVRQDVEENKKYGGWTTYFGFVLDEHYLDDALFYFETSPKKNSYKNVSHFESRRTYLSDGTLNCFSDTDDRCSKKFVGRDEKITNVKEGDIAIEWNGDELTPILIDKVAFTKEEWKERFAPDAYGDFTDDSGVAFIAGYGHCHPFSPHVFPLSCLPFYKVSKKTLNAMNAVKKKYYAGEAI